MNRLNSARKSFNCSIFRKNYSSPDNESQDYVPTQKKKGGLPQLSPSDEEKMNKLKEKLISQAKGDNPAEFELNFDDLDDYEPSTLVMKAVRYISQNRLDDAIKLLNKSIEKSPGLTIAHTTMGHAYRSKGDLVNARDFFKKAIALDSKCVDALIGLANVAIIEKNYEDAMRLLNEALQLDEDYPTTHTTFGMLYDKMGNVEEAIKHHKKALQSKDVNDPQAFSIFAELLAREGKFEDSLIYLNKAIKLDPDFGSGYVALVLVNLELNNWRLCQEYATKVLKISQSEELTKKQFGHTNFRNKMIGLVQYLATKAKESAQKDDFELGIKLSELCLILMPREEELLILNALCYFKANKLEDAVAKLNFTLSIHQKSYYALTMMSEVKAKLGESAEAFQYLLKAQHSDPRRAQVDQSINE
jgi:tetratricopeptide (TPR) repeat protein